VSHCEIVFVAVLAIAAVMGVALRADAHGTPIQVSVVNNTLAVSGGLADSAGYAPMIFVETTEEGDPFGEVNLSGFGQSIIWQIPGYVINGMAEHSGLFLDVMSRPVQFSNPVDYRSLWYWNPETQLVEMPPSANPFQIRKSTSANVTLSPTSAADPPPLQIAEPVAADTGFHNHLVAYALNEDSPPPVGAYGFFARLTSNQYGASDPFLVVFNNSVFDYDEMAPAALAINASAFLPGDYTHDDRVSAADYTTWRKTLNTSASYVTWRENFGLSVSASVLLTGANVPEPSAGFLLVGGILFACASCRRQRVGALRG
jgi:hypothetical protein